MRYVLGWDNDLFKTCLKHAKNTNSLLYTTKWKRFGYDEQLMVVNGRVVILYAFGLMSIMLYKVCFTNIMSLQGKLYEYNVHIK